MSFWQIIVLVFIVAIVTAVIATLRTRHKDIKKVAYMMDALEDGELNFRFQETDRFNRTLNRIRTIFEKQRQAHEQDSWTRLIRVLTHEIMNTVSPIASLSDALSRSMDGWTPSATPPRISSSLWKPTGNSPAWPGRCERPSTCRN